MRLCRLLWDLVLKNDSENQDVSKGVEPGLLFILPFLGYAIAYVYEAGAFALAEVPRSHISVSVPNIVAGCLSLVVPLFSAALATAASSRKFLERGWMGFMRSVLITAIPYAPLAAFGLWTENILSLFLVASSILLYAAVSLAYLVQKSQFYKKYLCDFPPLVQKILNFSVFGTLTLALGFAAGAVSERTTNFIDVIDVQCGAYSRVFRTNGDSMLVVPAFRGPGYSFELWSLSNRGTVRIKLVSQDEFASRRDMAGPCPR